MAPYSIDIVTTRPVAQNYYMFVLGGPPAIVGVSGPFLIIAGCTVGPRNAIDLTPDVLNGIGGLQGLGETTAPADCMCIGNPGCGTDGLCTFGSGAPTSNVIENGRADNCGYTPTEDELSLLAGTLGCR